MRWVFLRIDYTGAHNSGALDLEPAQSASPRVLPTMLKLVTAVFPPRLVTRYVAVGAVIALTEIALFYAFLRWLELALMTANVSAACLVTLLAFVAQKNFTFRAGGRTTPQAMLFAMQVTVNFVLNNALVFLFGELLQLHPLVAKVLQIGLCFMFNFSFSRFVVFGNRTTMPVGERREPTSRS
jgi:putative flippase GtrA